MKKLPDIGRSQERSFQLLEKSDLQAAAHPDHFTLRS